MNAYDFHKYQQGLDPQQKQGMLLTLNILNDYLDKSSTRDEEDIDYLNIINDVMIGPMEKNGLEWTDIFHILDHWNDTEGTGDFEDNFHYIDKGMFRDTLERYWGIQA